MIANEPPSELAYRKTWKKRVRAQGACRASACARAARLLAVAAAAIGGAAPLSAAGGGPLWLPIPARMSGARVAAKPPASGNLDVAVKRAARAWGVDAQTEMRVHAARLGGPPAAIYSLGATGLMAPVGDAGGAAKRFLTAFAPVYGLSEADMAGVALEERPGLAGGREVVVTEAVSGRRLYGARLRVHFASDGEFVAAAGTLYGGLRLEGSEKLSRDEAYAKATAFAAKLTGADAEDADGEGAHPGVGADAAAEIDAMEVVAYPLGDVARLAWVVTTVAAPNGVDRFEMVVDAVDGRILEVVPLTWYDGPQGQVFTSSSPQPSLTPGIVPPVPNPPPYAARSVVPFVGDAVMDPSGWVTGTTLAGNNADVRKYQSWMGFFLLPSAATAISAPGADFQFPLQLGPGQPDIRNYPDATGTNLFYLVNVAHDYFYALGFDEAHGNFQADNFGRGGEPDDSLIALTQLGAGAPGSTPYFRSNAWMSTPADGSRPLMGMYVWGRYPGSYYTDSSLDAEVVLHEYAHGVTARLGTGFTGAQGGAINEGNSDLFALNYLTPASAPADGTYPSASYSGQEFTTGIRTYPYSTQLAVNPLTYDNFGHVTDDGPEIHRDGEIWAVTMWEVRAALIGRRGYSEGRTRTAQLLVDALQLAPDFPSMIAMRDALLAAERNRYAGMDQDVLWQAFAKRGMGFMAAGGDAFSAHVLAGGGTPTPAAQVRLWEDDLYLGETVRLLVGDSSAAAAPLVSLTSTNGDSETVTLSQDGAVYSGTVAAGGSALVQGNGTLELAPGATLTATTADGNPGAGTPSLSDTASVHAPYAISQSSSLFDAGLATTLLGKGDDTYWRRALPFPFVFFGVEYTTVWVSSNGLLTFGGGVSGWYESIDEPGALPFIAPFACDLVTDGTTPPDEGVYYYGGADRFTVLWKAHESGQTDPVNVAASLFPNGSIRFDYGTGNGLWGNAGAIRLGALVGIGRGTETFSQALTSHYLATQSEEAQRIYFMLVDAGTPEVAVSESGHSVLDAQAAAVFFGGVRTGAAAPSRTFTVRNEGYAALSLGTVRAPAGFTVTEGLATSLAPGASDTFTVQMDTTSIGTKSGEVSFATSDPDENPFDFPVTGAVGTLTPCSAEVPRVIPASSTITSTLSIAGATTGTTDVDVILTITHADDYYLDAFLIGPTGIRVELFTGVGGIGSNFVNTVLDDEAATAITSGTAPFTGLFRPEGSLAALDDVSPNGTWTLEVSNRAASTGSLVSWCLAVTTAAEAKPEISVVEGGTAIRDGQTMPLSFGLAALGTAGPTKSLTVRNVGTATLTLDAVSVPTGFTVTEGLAASLPPGASDTFTVRLDTTTGGTKSGVLSFSNNDPNENPFDVPVAGIVASLTPCAAEVPKAIPASSTVTSTLSIAGATTGITDVDVILTITHSNDLFLDAFLIGPTGIRVELFTGAGSYGGANFVNTVLDDEAATAITSGTAPFTGSFRPEGSLAALDDFSPNGTWTLEVSNRVSSAGSLVSWCLVVTTAAEAKPEISVVEGGIAIGDGQTTPLAFGLAAVGTAGPTKSLTVRNDGTATLTLGAVSVPTGFTVTEGLATNLAPGASDTFTVRLDTTTGGTRSGVLSFSNNDPNENPFDVPVTGIVASLTPCAAEVPKAIPASSTVTSTLSIAGATTGITDVDVILTITHHNGEYVDAFLIGPTGIRVELFTRVGWGSNFVNTVLDDEAATAITSGTAPFTGSFRPEGSLAALDDFSPNGTWTLEVSNRVSSTGSLVSWCLVVTTAAEAKPEITVLEGGTAIRDGQSVPVSLGFGALGTAGPTRTFAVRNDGTAVLAVEAVNVPDGFTLTEGLPTSLAPGASDTFTVRLNTTTGGTKSGVLSFSNNDPNENPFDFPVTGTVGTLAPCAGDVPKAVPTSGTSTSSLSIAGATTAITDVNVLLTITHSNDYFVDAFLISPTGARVELFTGVGWGSNFVETMLDDEAATSIIWDSAPFTGSFRPEGSLAALDGGSPNGTWALEVTSHGFSAGSIVSWCLAVTTGAPEITVLDGLVEIAAGETAAVDLGSASPGAAGPTRTFTVRNDGTATLTLGAVSVPAGFALAEGLVPSLAPGVSDTFTVRLDTRVTGDKQGQISFSTNDGNENPFNFAIAGTVRGRPRQHL